MSRLLPLVGKPTKGLHLIRENRYISRDNAFCQLHPMVTAFSISLII